MRPPSIRHIWHVPAALLAGILAGSVLITPALGHIAGVTHTWNQHFRPLADARYVNVNEKAPNAELLDGQDSTAFLGVNAKAADADKLDGADGNLFVTGPGLVEEGAVSLLPNSSGVVLPGQILNHV
jgi:hypothetical protein